MSDLAEVITDPALRVAVKQAMARRKAIAEAQAIIRPLLATQPTGGCPCKINDFAAWLNAEASTAEMVLSTLMMVNGDMTLEAADPGFSERHHERRNGATVAGMVALASQ